MRRPMRGVIGVLGAIVIGAAVAACGGSSSSATTAGAQNTSGGGSSSSGGSATSPATSTSGELKVGMASGDIDSLDPQRWYFASTWGLSNGVCTTILRYADAGGAAGVKLVPGLAEMPQVTSGGKTYVYHLRAAKFADGQTITGADLKYSIERMLSPAVDPGTGQYFYGVQGANAYVAGKANTISGIVATPTSVTFKLTAPDGSFPYKTALPNTCPVAVGTPKKPDGAANLLEKYSSGPFKVESYTPNRSMVWVRNPDYNAALGARGHVSKINFQIGVDPSQAGLDIKAGNIDLYTGFFGTADIDQLGSDPTLKGQTVTSQRPAVMTLWLNNTVAPFNNVDVRKAVNYAVNRVAVQKAYGGLQVGTPTSGILPPTVPSYTSGNVYPSTPDLVKAKSLMQASGIKTPVHTYLRVRSDAAGYIPAAESVQSALASIGIIASIKSAPDSVNTPIVANPKSKVPMGINTFSMDFPDGESFINVLLDPRTPEAAPNFARFHDTSFSAAYDRVTAESGTPRAQGYVALDKSIMTQAAPWAPLLTPIRFDFVSSRVRGYVYSQALDAFNYNTLGLK